MIIQATILILICVNVIGTTNGTEMNCVPLIRVPRNSVFRAPVMTKLKINCTITLDGCHRNPRVSWCKLNGSDCKALNYSHHIRTEWKDIKKHEWMAFLIFLNISMEDTGLYRCKEGDTSVSHAINVTVTGADDDLKWLGPYVYICSGVGLVFIVMTVSFLYVIRHQGTKSTRKDKANKNQYMDTHKKDLLLPPHLYLNSDLLTSVVYRV
ncbi:B- and T-lymphocyte attenuator-like isoform X2 [Cyprinus carpio]|uniref:B- and T-lymphocyte attenuator-like isoform X2 n=1 Tax=Cyprinus carpio TaxID=7962 RepID=A0A9Q9V6J0_CYPCA|nr:B- and T-lymphocyte attenuator-like isoform X2 [Cyprinus carpio]